MYKIEKNVDHSPALRLRKWADLAKQMGVGDSVLVASTNEAQCLYQAIVSLYRVPNEDNTQLSTRRIQSDGTYRVWRIS